ncbi:MAG: WecB/TagA/CpsF family glycosyltransferase [Chloroflexi bacterium]|jgi:N-acetylglucosaminyldiphosphoundecaprenol N-acetyl-beta-D-mannosaminyltransferase|nr:WecB/TagA/CpsF family glycosyltransferase [Chloroflexota bacterium]
MPPRPHRRVLGVRVDDVTYNDALDTCASVARRAGIGPGRSLPPCYAVTPNPEFVMLARRMPDFAQILEGASVSVPDGVGLMLAARIQGMPLREQVRGTDLAYGLVEWAASSGARVFLLGAADGVADAAAAKLCRRWPHLAVAGTFAGDASPAGDPATRSAVQAAGRCDLLLVAYGAPRQERWIARNLHSLDVGLAIGVGGVLDFMAGRVRRAPEPVRRAGLDWLFRLAMQPSRLRRQATSIPAFVVLAAAEAIRMRLGGRG